MSELCITRRVCLKPTKEQEEQFKLFVRATHLVYNICLECREQAYQQNKSTPRKQDLRNYISSLIQDEQYKWMSAVSCETLRHAIDDLNIAYERFFKGLSNKPRKKNRYSKKSFYTRADRLRLTDENNKTVNSGKYIKIDKIKQPIELCETIEIPVTAYNPRIKYDGLNWYLTFGVKYEGSDRLNQVYRKHQKRFNQLLTKPSTPSLGIDLGIKDTAILSNKNVYPNLTNKQSLTDEQYLKWNRELYRLNKKVKRIQRAISRKYEINKIEEKYHTTKNIIKEKQRLRQCNHRINFIYRTYYNQIIIEIIKSKPSRIVIEDLKVTNMMKNHKLARSIQSQRWRYFRESLEYYCKLYRIPLVIVPSTYPSSKLCSACGYKKSDLTLEDRIYHCPSCGLILDRDYNASLNLANFR